MLVLCKILGLFINTFTEEDKCCLLYRENLTQPIRRLLSHKQKIFSQFFSPILKSTLNFAHFHKDDSQSRCVSKITVSGKGD